MSDAAPYTVPKEPGRWRAIALAALVHAALIALLWFGVRWQNETPAAVEAEIWSPRAMEAAPRPEPPPPRPPEPEPKPKPAVKEVPKPEPVVAPKPPPVAKPDIALEQEKKKRKLQEEKAQRLAEEREEERKKLVREKELADARKKELADARKKELADAKKKEAADQEKKEAAAADLKRKQLAEAQRKQRAEAEARAETQAAEARRQEDMNRLRNQAQAGSGGAGDAPKAQGSRADASYISRVGAKIKSNTTFNVPDNLAGNPPVEYSVELLPDGSLRGVRKLQGSGVTGFDEAVRRAIEKSAPFPPDKSGTVPSGFTVSHKPKDL